jgi:hypothetical protein
MSLFALSLLLLLIMVIQDSDDDDIQPVVPKNTTTPSVALTTAKLTSTPLTHSLPSSG